MAGEWREVQLDEIVEVYDGPHATPKKTDSGPIFLGISNLTHGRIDLSNTEHVSEEDFQRWTRRITPQPGDIVFSYETRLGEAAVIPPDLRCCLGRRMGLLRSRPGRVDSRFLLYAYLGDEFQETLRARTIHGSTVDRIPLIDMPKFLIRVPVSIDDQRTIAHILGTLDDKIELNRRMNETLEAMARAIFKSWFMDFDPVRAKAERRDPGLPKPLADLFPDSFEDSELGEIPKGWKIGPVGDHMMNFDSRRVPVSGRERAKRQGSYPYHGAAGIMDHVDDYLFDGIFLLVGEDGSVIKDDGKAVTQYVWGKTWVNNHAHVLQGKGSVSTEQLYLYFHFERVSPYVTGAVQPKLSQGRMNSMLFVFAGDDICCAFTQLAAPLFSKLRTNFESIKSLTVLRDTLLPKLISGELQIHDPECVVASNTLVTKPFVATTSDTSKAS